MLDLTSDGYFIDENKTPLSLLEMRRKFAQGEFVTYVQSTAVLKNLQDLRAKRRDANMYICKNLFYFQVDQYSAFGERKKYLYFVPRDYSISETEHRNLKYMIDKLPPEHEAYRKKLEERMLQSEHFPEPRRTDIRTLLRKPF